MKKLIIFVLIMVCLFSFSSFTFAEEFLTQPENYTVYVTNTNGLNYYKATGSMNNFVESSLVLQGTYKYGEKVKIGREYELEEMYGIVYDDAFHNSDTSNFIYVKLSEIGKQTGFMDYECINFENKVNATVITDNGVEIFKGPQIELFESTGTIIPKGTQIDIYGFKSGYNNRVGNKYWKYVKYNGIEGYIHTSYGEIGIEQIDLISIGASVYENLEKGIWNQENISGTIPLNTIIKNAWLIPNYGLDDVYYVEYDNIKGFVFSESVGVYNRFSRLDTENEKKIILYSTPFHSSYNDEYDILYSGDVTSGEIIKVNYTRSAYEEATTGYVTYNGISGWVGEPYDYTSNPITCEYSTKVISPDGCDYFIFNSIDRSLVSAEKLKYNEVKDIYFFGEFYINGEKYIQIEMDNPYSEYVYGIKDSDLKKLDVAKYFMSEKESIMNDTDNSNVNLDDTIENNNTEGINNSENISLEEKNITIVFSILIAIILILIIVVIILVVKRNNKV